MPMMYLGLVILAWLIVWHFILRAFAAKHADSPAAQGLANLS
jgi:hypothetical protein